jgi:hypothetical protein
VRHAAIDIVIAIAILLYFSLRQTIRRLNKVRIDEEAEIFCYKNSSKVLQEINKFLSTVIALSLLSIDVLKALFAQYSR